MAAAKQVNSDVVTNVLAGTLNAANTSMNAPAQRANFIVTSPSTGIIGANADIVMLCYLPKGAKVQGGVWRSEAGGAAAVCKIGTFNPTTFAAISDAAFIGAGGITDMTAAVNLPFIATVALGYGSVMATDVLVGATFATATFQATAKIYGHIDFTL